MTNQSPTETLRIEFDHAVKKRHPELVFKPECVAVHEKGHWKQNEDWSYYSGCDSYTYEDARVGIVYRGKVTFCKDDYDYFVDVTVPIDGAVVEHYTN